MTPKPDPNVHAPISLAAFTARLGLNPVTIWRWRKKAWIATINIAGRQYITRAEIERFNSRAEAGEFARDPAIPRTSTRSRVTRNADSRHQHSAGAEIAENHTEDFQS
jgi:hypothetical protein